MARFQIIFHGKYFKYIQDAKISSEIHRFFKIQLKILHMCMDTEITDEIKIPKLMRFKILDFKSDSRGGAQNSSS